MPVLRNVLMSQNALAYILGALGRNLLLSIRVISNDINNTATYEVQYIGRRGSPDTFLYTESNDDRLRASTEDSREQPSPMPEPNLGRVFRYATPSLPSSWGEILYPSGALVASIVSDNAPLDPPHIEFEPPESGVSGPGNAPLDPPHIEFEPPESGVSGPGPDESFESWDHKQKEKSRKEHEEFMTELKLNPTKKYKNYLTVHYDESVQRNYGHEIYRIEIFDIITGLLLGSNLVRLSQANFLGFEAYAAKMYEHYCPILNRDVPQAARTYAEFTVTEATLEQFSSRLANFNDLVVANEKDIMHSIKQSSVDSLGYWLDFQIRIYQQRVAAEGAKKFLEDMANIRNTGEIKASLAMLHLYHCIGQNISPSRKIESKHHRMHYRLSEVINNPISSHINLVFPGRTSQAFIKDFVKFTVKKTEVKIPEKLTPEQLITNLPSLTTALNTSIHNLYANDTFGRIKSEDILYHLIQGKLNRATFGKAFTQINDIKNSYMFLGQTEEEAMVNALNKDEMLREDKRCKDFGYCAVTKQFLPMLFLTPYKEGYISTYYAYIHSSVATPNGVGKYNAIDGKCVDTPVLGQQDYEISVYNHKRNAMEFLTLRKRSDENTTITSDVSLFNPTPFMGIELEVQQQETAKYMINGKECFAPANITTQVYDALGRDYVIIKRDGSLRGYNPFEIVTVPATLGYHQDRWESFLNNKELKKYLTSFASGNCGMHIHINRESFTGLHLAKFMRFINCRDNFEFITSVAQRSHNRYAEFLSETRSGGFARYFRGNPDRRGSSEEKYMAVNTKPTATVEVRIFRGNLAKIGFLKNLEFVHAAWVFTKDTPLTALTFKEFMFWLFNPSNNTKDYKSLKMWLLASGWNVDGVVVKKTDTGIQRQRKEERRAQVMKAREKIRKQFDLFVENKAKVPQELRISKDEIISAA